MIPHRQHHPFVAVGCLNDKGGACQDASYQNLHGLESLPLHSSRMHAHAQAGASAPARQSAMRKGSRYKLRSNPSSPKLLLLLPHRTVRTPTKRSRQAEGHHRRVPEKQLSHPLT